jgi:hypothetical protein
MKNRLRLELLDYATKNGELFVFQYNPKNNAGIFSISDVNNGTELRQVVYTNISKKKFASNINKIINEYEKITV